MTIFIFDHKYFLPTLYKPSVDRMQYLEQNNEQFESSLIKQSFGIADEQYNWFDSIKIDDSFTIQ